MPTVGGNAALLSTYAGTYSAATAYKAGQVVTFSGGSYLALVASTNVSPTAGASNATWALIAAKGDTGAAGSSSGTGTVTYSSGKWYDIRTAWAPAAQMGGASMPVSTLYYTPCYLFSALPINAVGFALGGGTASSAGATMRVGLYGCNADGSVGSRVTDWGEIAITTNSTFVGFTATVSATLPAGWNYFALQSNTNLPGYIMSVTSTNNMLLPAVGSTLGPNANGSTGPAVAYKQSNSGALPASPSGLTTILNTTSTDAPFNVWYRAA